VDRTESQRAGASARIDHTGRPSSGLAKISNRSRSGEKGRLHGPWRLNKGPAISRTDGFRAKHAGRGRISHSTNARILEFAEGLENAAHGAAVDAVAGLASRAMAEAYLATQFGVRRSTLVLLTDLNGLKQVNYRWGHSCGDQILKSVAHGLAESSKSQDKTAFKMSFSSSLRRLALSRMWVLSLRLSSRTNPGRREPARAPFPSPQAGLCDKRFKARVRMGVRAPTRPALDRMTVTSSF
jgi:hypothetical protein